MAIAPSKPVERAAFYQEKSASPDGPWVLQATNIGTTTAAVSDLNAKAQTALDKWQVALAARAAAKTATQDFYQAIATMSEAGADVIQSVRTKAGVSGPEIWTLADLPAPATPSPVGPPGTPDGFRAELVQGGALLLSWKCQNPKGAVGTVYQIARQAAGGAMTILGATGKKSFIDETLPSGLAQVTYKITAIRSTKQGLPGEFTVKFGVGGSGEMTATVVAAGAGGAPKLAA